MLRSNKVRDDIDPENLDSRKDDRRRRTGSLLEILAVMITVMSIVWIALTFPVTIWRCARIIPEYERVVVFRLGRLIKNKVKGPGLFWIIPWLDEIYKVDLRTVCVHVEPQQVLTADSVPLHIDAVVFYRVVDPARWVIRVQDGPHLTLLLAQTSLRALVGTHSLSQLISNRRSMAQAMEEAMSDVSRLWGVHVQRVEFRAVSLPVMLLRCMALEAEAHRLARAKLISAQGELGASLALQRAASSLSPIALHLRYLQSLSSADSSASVIVSVLPIELCTKIMSYVT